MALNTQQNVVEIKMLASLALIMSLRSSVIEMSLAEMQPTLAGFLLAKGGKDMQDGFH